jgi:ribose transport system ATP-binding protein
MPACDYADRGSTEPGSGEKGRSMTLEVRELSKTYGSTDALAAISFTAYPGQTLAILGQNGAGKSTLVKILAGVLPATAGSIALDGKPMTFSSPRDALKAGIVGIPQELAFLRSLSVAENILMGSWNGRRVISQRSLVRPAAEFAAAIGLDVDLTVPMSALTLAQCQLVEIAKALSRNARVVLLDEPTAALSDVEAERLFEVLTRLRQRGVITLYISHRLDEVLTHTDRALILRDGRSVACYDTADASQGRLIGDMIGDSAADSGPATAVPDGGQPSNAGPTAALRLSAVSHRGGGLADVSVTVAAGEIVGLFGVRGSGHEAMIRTLVGLQPHDAGELEMGGVSRGPLRSPLQARKAGVAYVPGDRKKQGLALDQSLRQNLTAPQLGRFTKLGVVSRRREQEFFETVANRLRLKYATSTQPIRELSGGNQQKILLASRIYRQTPLLIIEEPTRGVDVGARSEIHALLMEVAASGTTIVFATSDLEEAVSLSDRLLVFQAGRLVGSLSGADKTGANALSAAGQQFEVR